MNKCLMMLLHEGADLIAGVSPTRCLRDFDDLSATISFNNPVAETQQSKLALGVQHIRTSVTSAKSNVSERCKTILEGFRAPKETHHESRLTKVSDFANVVDVKADDDLEEAALREEALLEADDNLQSETIPLGQGTACTQECLSDSQRPPQSTDSLPPGSKEPKQQAKDREPMVVPPTTVATLNGYQDTLPGLRLLVEFQVEELSRSIQALSQFSRDLPAIFDSMLYGHSQTRARRDDPGMHTLPSQQALMATPPEKVPIAVDHFRPPPMWPASVPHPHLRQRDSPYRMANL